MKKLASQEFSRVSFSKSRDTIPRKLFKNRDLFLSGLIMMAAFLFNPSTLLRIPQFLLFWFYAWFMGKKNKPLLTLLVMLSIVFFNLLVPYGKVLIEFGLLPITQGSLLAGLHKAVTLEGLIMLSKASIPPDLPLPGSFGSLLGESLWIFQRITEQKRLIPRKHLIEGLDALLLGLSAEQEARGIQSGIPGTEPQRTLRGILLLIGAVFPILSLTVIGYIQKLN